MTTETAAVPAASSAGVWATRAFLAGMGALGLGMALALLGVNLPSFFLPGVVLIDVAFTLLAVAGVLRALPT